MAKASAPQPPSSGYGADLGSQSVRIRTSVPDAIFRHNISDEEIGVFVNSSRDGFTDTMWGAVGAALSLSPPVISNVVPFCSGEKPLSREAALEMVFWAASLAIAVTLCLLNKKRDNTARALAKKIRERKAFSELK